jgi:hypothetical protein
MGLKTKVFVNTVLGISTEILYALFIMAAAFLICFIASFKR